MEKVEYLLKADIKLESMCNYIFNRSSFFYSTKAEGKEKKNKLLIVPLEYVFIENIYCQ